MPALVLTLLMASVVHGASWYVALNTTQVSLVVGPTNSSVVLNYVGEAREAVYMEVYELTYTPLINELVSLARHGVAVYVVLSCNVYGGVPQGELNAVGELRMAGAHVSFNCLYEYVHSKVFVIDNETVILGSINPTYYGFTRDLGIDLVIHNSTIARVFASIILSDYYNKTLEAVGYPGVVVSPINSQEYLSELLSQPGPLVMAMEELYPSSGMYGLIQQHTQRLVLVGSHGENQYAVSELGAEMISGLTAKAIVVGDYIYVGSVNLDYTSLHENRELGIIIENPVIANEVASVIESWAGMPSTSASSTSTPSSSPSSTTLQSPALSTSTALIAVFFVILLAYLAKALLRRGRRRRGYL